MMVDENGNGRFRAGQFQGRVESKLENICEAILELKAEVHVIHKRVTGIQVKVAGISATVALVVSLVMLLVKSLIE